MPTLSHNGKSQLERVIDLSGKLECNPRSHTCFESSGKKQRLVGLGPFVNHLRKSVFGGLGELESI